MTLVPYLRYLNLLRMFDSLIFYHFCERWLVLNFLGFEFLIITHIFINLYYIIILHTFPKIFSSFCFLFFDPIFQMYLCILVFPFLSFVFTNLLGRFLGVKASCMLSTFSIFLSFIFSILAFYEVAVKSSFCTVTLTPWINTDLFICHWGFFFDTIASVMLIVVCSVSCLVH